MTAFLDTFTEAAAPTDLTLHVSDSGTAWSQLVGTAGGTSGLFVTTAGRVRGSSASGASNVITRNAYVPGSADYDVTADLVAVDATNGLRVGGRVGTGGQGYYMDWGVSSATLAIRLFAVPGSGPANAVQIGSATIAAVTASATKTLVLRMAGSQISVLDGNGATVIAPVTDTTVTAAGGVGIWDPNLGFPGGGTSRVQVDAMRVSLPVFTTAPSVTGTPAIGSTLTCDGGTSTGGGAKSYQWQDSVDSGTTWANIAGATAVTLAVASAEAGRKLRCAVVQVSGAGSTTAYSNVVSVAGAPVNTTLPSITTDGTPSTGEPITGLVGAFTNATTYTIQFYRGSSPITGASSNSAATALDYLLVQSDEGAALKIGVIAHGPGGDSSEAFSPTITPAVTAPIGDASGLAYYSGGAGNTDPAASIGGARGGTIPDMTVGNVFGTIPGSVAQAGGIFYARIYMRNTHATSNATGGACYVEQQLAHTGMTIAVATPQEAAGADLAVLASRITPPSGSTFTTAASQGTGQAYGDLQHGQARGLDLKLTIAAGTTKTTEDVPDHTFSVAVGFTGTS